MVGKHFRRMAAMIGIAAVTGISSCVPPPPPEPPASTVISPGSGPRGSYIQVTADNDECWGSGGYAYLQATLTTNNGVVIANGYRSINDSFSGNGSPDSFSGNGSPDPFSGNGGLDPFVQLRVPLFAGPGRYFVYLTCYSGYSEQFEYTPARFRVTLR